MKGVPDCTFQVISIHAMILFDMTYYGLYALSSLQGFLHRCSHVFYTSVYKFNFFGYEMLIIVESDLFMWDYKVALVQNIQGH